MSGPTADRPAHVPPAALFDFDVFDDPALLADPHQRAQELLTLAPALFWTPRNGGHWVATRHRDAARVLGEPDTFSSQLMSAAQQAGMAALRRPDGPRIPELKPIMMDPPQHTRFRLPLQQAFAPRRIQALAAEVEALAHQLLDEVVAQGGCDFVGAVAEQLPVRVFLKLMGLPAERLVEFRELVREVFAPSHDDPMVYGLRMRKVVDAMMGEILARRAEPRDDLISQLWALQIDGEPMTLELMEDFCGLLFLAGLDTVINGIGFGMRRLAADPALQRELRADPALIPAATEELLRRYTFTVPIRRVICPTELGGRRLQVDDKVMLYLPAVGLDTDVYAAAEQLDLTRSGRHLAFGSGPHFCVGANLARLELRILYAVVLQRLPEFRLDTAEPIRFHAGQMLSLANLPLRWD